MPETWRKKSCRPPPPVICSQVSGSLPRRRSSSNRVSSPPSRRNPRPARRSHWPPRSPSRCWRRAIPATSAGCGPGPRWRPLQPCSRSPSRQRGCLPGLRQALFFLQVHAPSGRTWWSGNTGASAACSSARLTVLRTALTASAPAARRPTTSAGSAPREVNTSILPPRSSSSTARRTCSGDQEPRKWAISSGRRRSSPSGQ